MLCRPRADYCIVVGEYAIMESFKQVLTTLRDLLLPLFPSFLARIVVGRTDFVFLVHPIDLEDVAKKYPFMRGMERSRIKAFTRYLWPVIGARMVGCRAGGKPLTGRIMFCPMTTRMMLLKREEARHKILKAARLAEKLGVRMLGLGAFVPIVTDNGAWLSDKVKVSLTTGTAFAAVIAEQNIRALMAEAGMDPAQHSLAIVGAGGSVGAACARMLCGSFRKAVLVDINGRALGGVVNSLYSSGERLPHVVASTSLSQVYEADVVLVVTNVPGALVRSHHLRPGAVVVDAGFPKNVSRKVLKDRRDVLVVDSGIAEIDGFETQFDFHLGVQRRSEVFSCLAEELLLLQMNKKGMFVGVPTFEYVQELRAFSRTAGIRRAEFRNGLGPVAADDIARFRAFRAEYAAQAAPASGAAKQVVPPPTVASAVPVPDPNYTGAVPGV